MRRCDGYLDRVAAEASDPVDVGPLRAFVSRAPWPLYVRPRAELDLVAPVAVTLDDVEAAADVLRAAGQAVSFEWIEARAPALGPLLSGSGYTVTSYPLLVLELSELRPDPAPAAPPARMLDADSPDLVAALAVQDVGFDVAGTAVGPQGHAERDAYVVEEGHESHVRRRIRAGRSLVAVVDSPGEGIVAVGWHQPTGAETEIVGVATLPSHRRRGAAAEVLRVLLLDAQQRGVSLALLSADDDDVARIYERSGFERIGSVGAAVPTER